MKRRYIFLVFAGLVALVYYRPLFGGETFVLRDHLSYVLPSRTHLATALALGELPEWWEGVGLGTPFAANPNHGVFYPPIALVAVLPPPHAADVILALHVLWAALGTFLLARRLGADRTGGLIAGGAILLSGYLSSLLPQCLAALTFAWIPWVAWGAERVACAATPRERVLRVLELSGIWALQILSGDPVGTLDAGLLAGLVILSRSRRVRGLTALASAAVVAVALAAIMVFPAAQLLRESERAQGLGLGDATKWSLHPARLIEVVWPGAFGDATEPISDLSPLWAEDVAGNQAAWSFSLHLGAGILLLAAFARARARVLALGAAFLAVLALGENTPLYALFHALPVGRLMRYPEKHIAPVLIIIASLGGVGWSELQEDVRRFSRLALLVGASISLLAVFAYFGRSVFELEADRLDRGAAYALSYGLVAGLTLVAAGAVLRIRRSSLPLAAGASIRRSSLPLAASLLLFPGFLHALALQKLVDRSRIEATPAILSSAAPPSSRRVGLPRVYRMERSFVRGNTMVEMALASHDTAVPNMAYAHGFADVPGYDPALAKRLSDLVERAEKGGAADRIAVWLDIEHLILPTEIAGNANLLPAGKSPDGASVLVANPSHRPRAFVAPRWMYGPDSAAFTAILTDDLDPARVVIARDEPVVGEGSAEAPPVPCAISRNRPEEALLECDSPAGGYAVLLDAWAPGWTATVDGEPQAIERADVVARAVRVGPGPHSIRFSYVTPGLWLGMAVSGGAWIAWALGMILLRRRRSQVTTI